MRNITKTVYKIDEHPEPSKCFDWIRENVHDLNEHGVDDLVYSLKALEFYVFGTLDYSVGQFPDRGEFIRITGYSVDRLADLVEIKDDLPLTGVFWDSEVIAALAAFDFVDVLYSLHSETEYIYSDEGLLGLCEANEWEFYLDGSMV